MQKSNNDENISKGSGLFVADVQHSIEVVLHKVGELIQSLGLIVADDIFLVDQTLPTIVNEGLFHDGLAALCAAELLGVMVAQPQDEDQNNDEQDDEKTKEAHVGVGKPKIAILCPDPCDVPMV